mmetsp:Transcript_35490/g.54289  ORF Transcript_35490/g.54289 Transcript_35490/m.54289 type:complete len:217 (-) Transcript_35490:857-1507(-)
MQEGPASIATLVHVVASHQKLGAQDRNLAAVLQLQPRFDNLCERNCVARATSSLVSQGVGEVKAIDVSEIVRFRNHIIRDIFGVLILVHPALGLGEGLIEFLAAFLAEILRLLVLAQNRASLSKTLGVLGIAVSPVVGVVSLQFAHVCLPAQILAVDKRDSEVRLIRGLVLSMSIEPLSGFSGLRSRLSLCKLEGGMVLRSDDFILRSNNGHLDSV